MKTTGQLSLGMAFIILPFVYGCQTMRSEATVKIPATEKPQDEALCRSVREKLINTSNIIYTALTWFPAQYYLTGTVTSLDERQQAGKIAWNARGVETVVNTLAVWS
jgi:osmotically-inducible protein OsmY